MVRPDVLFKYLRGRGWTLERITGSHHIFTKGGCGCLPVVVHQGAIRLDVFDSVIVQAIEAENRPRNHTTRHITAKVDIKSKNLLFAPSNRGGGACASGAPGRRGEPRRLRIWVDRDTGLLATFDAVEYEEYLRESMAQAEADKTAACDQYSCVLDEALEHLTQDRFAHCVTTIENFLASKQNSTTTNTRGSTPSATSTSSPCSLTTAAEMAVADLREELEFTLIVALEKQIRGLSLRQGKEREVLCRKCFKALREMEQRHWQRHSDVDALRTGLVDFLTQTAGSVAFNGCLTIQKTGPGGSDEGVFDLRIEKCKPVVDFLLFFLELLVYEERLVPLRKICGKSANRKSANAKNKSGDILYLDDPTMLQISFVMLATCLADIVLDMFMLHGEHDRAARIAQSVLAIYNCGPVNADDVSSPRSGGGNQSTSNAVWDADTLDKIPCVRWRDNKAMTSRPSDGRGEPLFIILPADAELFERAAETAVVFQFLLDLSPVSRFLKETYDCKLGPDLEQAGYSACCRNKRKIKVADLLNSGALDTLIGTLMRASAYENEDRNPPFPLVEVADMFVVEVLMASVWLLRAAYVHDVAEDPVMREVTEGFTEFLIDPEGFTAKAAETSSGGRGRGTNSSLDRKMVQKCVAQQRIRSRDLMRLFGPLDMVDKGEMKTTIGGTNAGGGTNSTSTTSSTLSPSKSTSSSPYTARANFIHQSRWNTDPAVREFHIKAKILFEWVMKIDYVFNQFGLVLNMSDLNFQRWYGACDETRKSYLNTRFFQLSMLRASLTTILAHTGEVEQFGTTLAVLHQAADVLQSMSDARVYRPLSRPEQITDTRSRRAQTRVANNLLDMLLGYYPELASAPEVWHLPMCLQIQQYNENAADVGSKLLETLPLKRLTGGWIFFHQICTFFPIALGALATPADVLPRLRAAVENHAPMPQRYDRLDYFAQKKSGSVYAYTSPLKKANNGEDENTSKDHGNRSEPSSTSAEIGSAPSKRALPIRDVFLCVMTQLLDFLLDMGYFDKSTSFATVCTHDQEEEDAKTAKEIKEDRPTAEVQQNEVDEGAVENDAVVSKDKDSAEKTALLRTGQTLVDSSEVTGAQPGGDKPAKKSKNKQKRRAAQAAAASAAAVQGGNKGASSNSAKAMEHQTGLLAAATASQEVWQVTLWPARFTEDSKKDLQKANKSVAKADALKAAQEKRLETANAMQDAFGTFCRARALGACTKSKSNSTSSTGAGVHVQPDLQAKARTRFRDLLKAQHLSAKDAQCLKRLRDLARIEEIVGLLLEKRRLLAVLVGVYEEIVQGFEKVPRDSSAWRFQTLREAENEKPPTTLQQLKMHVTGSLPLRRLEETQVLRLTFQALRLEQIAGRLRELLLPALAGQVPTREMAAPNPGAQTAFQNSLNEYANLARNLGLELPELLVFAH
ncbi:unnamed protein product [Amoebophrya sp. A25]|nr:unnamed protein product [Amoebophrya sp. A25]|eukprot:GSA25T00017280001.1